MKRLQLGDAVLTREPIPRCRTCSGRGRTYSDCTCNGTGYQVECDFCGGEMNKPEQMIHVLDRGNEPALYACSKDKCIAHVVAEAVRTVHHDDLAEVA